MKRAHDPAELNADHVAINKDLTQALPLYARAAARFTGKLIVLLLLAWQSVYASDSDVGLWASGDYHLDLNDDWLASIIIQARFDNDLERLERLLFRPSVTFKAPHGIALTAGYDAHSVEAPRDNIEHRSWQQIAIKKPLGRLTSFAHARLEQRYFENVDDISLRLRLNAGINLPLRGGFTATLANEVFFTLNDVDGAPVSGFDQNRLFAGFSKRLTERLNVRLGYQMQYIDRSARDDLAGNQVFIFFTFK